MVLQQAISFLLIEKANSIWFNNFVHLVPWQNIAHQLFCHIKTFELILHTLIRVFKLLWCATYCVTSACGAAITVDQYQYRESSFGLIKEGGAVYEILEHGGASTFSALNHAGTHARRQAGTTRASVVRQDTCLHVLFNVQWARKGLPCFLNESNWKPRRPHSNRFSQKLRTIKACSCQLEWMVISFFFNTND